MTHPEDDPGAHGAGGADASSLLETPEARAERLEQEVAELQRSLDRAREDELRLLADLDNLRKRSRQEVAEARAAGRTEVIRDLLLLQDAVERGLASVGEGGTVEALVAGLRLIEKGIGDLLSRHGIERIASAGQTFDPRQHEAVGTVPASAEHPDHTIAREVRPGYRLRDHILRPAQVIVATSEAS